MDPKSCRQTPHWNIAMICSPFLLWFHSTSPSFVLWKCVFELNVSCHCVNTWSGLVRCGSTRGIFSRSFALQNSKAQNMQHEECAMSCFFLSHLSCNIFFYSFFCAYLEAFISALNIACCAPFEELLCAWRWRWRCCWGGAKLVAEGHGWEGGYFNVRKGQSSPLPWDPHMTE